ncbi:hypothetical protein GBZ26_06325 [Azospirillum formosense]|uniref:Uncharacterized protein n=1 Tax=Azospirillum formosense TaxID=861533 RepID=A0ABX2KW96_9PROT|nr:hypothetical protein [Azospirillum formosense]MBY3754901.1 hypothetical protein [Azospirillum formosense]NUB18827.1 hypothetical protein [Azospirillum formosense]
MMPFISLSPMALDHSFPRSGEDLDTAVDAIAGVIALIHDNKARLIITDMLAEFVHDFDWSRGESVPILWDIHRMLTSVILYNTNSCMISDTTDVKKFQVHPLPSHCASIGNTNIWQEEMGKLLQIHVQSHSGSGYCIGIACDNAFSGKKKSIYLSEELSFPLVSPEEIHSLLSGQLWDIHPDSISGDISFLTAKKNLKVLGDVRITKLNGGSHYKVTFLKGERPWALDKNDDPVPEPYLKELIDITKLPYDVIRYALINGKMPPKKWRIPVKTEKI